MGATGERTARVVWEGNLTDGSGAVTSVGSGALPELPIAWESRVEHSGGKTSPEELIAAAHASCFAMALSHTLNMQGKPPERLQIGATCRLELGEGGLRITEVGLEVRGSVPGLDEQEFVRIAREAEQSCPVSNALRGNVEIDLDAALA